MPSYRFSESANADLEEIASYTLESWGAAQTIIGALLMGVFAYGTNPYTVALWAGIYENATLGSLIASDETVLQTGQIPQDVLDWCASRQ